MARINIEDSFWLEILPMVLAVGDQDKAIGQVIRFFRFAQEKHKHGKLISEDEFVRQGFSENLIPSFAERVDGGIKCVGSDKHFGWLAKRVEAGKNGGSKPKQTKQTEANPSKRKQTQANPSKLSKVEQTEPSPSPSVLTTTKARDVENFEASFNQPELEKLEDVYSQVLDRKLGRPQKNLLTRVLAVFGDAQEFGIWAQGLIGSDRCPDVAADRSGFERYFNAALARKLDGAA